MCQTRLWYARHTVQLFHLHELLPTWENTMATMGSHRIYLGDWRELPSFTKLPDHHGPDMSLCMVVDRKPKWKCTSVLPRPPALNGDTRSTCNAYLLVGGLVWMLSLKTFSAQCSCLSDCLGWRSVPPPVQPRHMGPHGGWSVKPEFSYGNVHGAQPCHSEKVKLYDGMMAWVHNKTVLKTVKMFVIYI